MEVQDLNANSFADLFPAPTGPQQPSQLKFGMEESLLGDLLHVDETDKQVLDNQGDATKEADKEVGKEIDKELTDANKDVDLTGGEPDKDQQQQTPSTPQEIKGLSDYFARNLENGKFVAINDVDEKGNKIPFIPKTAEDFDEVFQVQLDYHLQQKQQEIDEKWYNTKSPAWKAVSQYAEMVDDPTQLIPFLQGVKTIQSVENINESEIDGAEQIIRIRMEQNNEPEEVISSQIESLKTTDKLIATAKIYKPVILNQEKQILAQEVRQRQIEEQTWAAEINDIRQKAYEEIEKPFFGKEVLKREEKVAIFNLLAEPSDETKGFGIYDELDKLFAKRDFETLKQVALLIAKKDSFYNYIGVDIANKTAGKLQRKLQAATEGRSASGNDYTEDKMPVANRNRSTGTVRFGR